MTGRLMPSRASPLAQVRRKSCNRHSGMSAGNSASSFRLFFEKLPVGAAPLVVNTNGLSARRGTAFKMAIAAVLSGTQRDFMRPVSLYPLSRQRPESLLEIDLTPSHLRYFVTTLAGEDQ